VTEATSRNLLRADLDWAVKSVNGMRWLPSLSAPAAVIPCEIVITGKPGTNGRTLNVRCRCQAQTRTPPQQRFYNYDVLGSAESLPGAVALWRAWHEENGAAA
jgi:hypothetical protein